MSHYFVNQLRFARSEFVRGLEGLTDEDARTRIEPANSISWMIGHLTVQESSYWVYYAQGLVIRPELRKLVGYGQPATTPPLDEMWAAWREITAAADPYLDKLTDEDMAIFIEHQGRTMQENVGTLLHRNIYHYWFHLGEAYGIRQALGHTDLPEFVGPFGDAAYK